MSVAVWASAVLLTVSLVVGSTAQREARPLVIVMVSLLLALLLPLRGAVGFWVVLACFMALVRRLLSADVALDPLTVLPTAVAAVVLGRAWRQLTLPKGAVGSGVRLLLICIVVSGAVSFTLSPIGAGYAGGQMLVGVAFGALLAGNSNQLGSAAIKSLLICGPLVAVYGLLQFFLMPEWDARWMIETHLESIGRPLPRQVRIFASLESPGPAALVLGLWIVFASAKLAQRTASGRWRVFLVLSMPAVTFALVLTAVRSVFLALGVAMLVGLARGGSSWMQRIVSGGFILAAGYAILGISERFGNNNALLGQERLTVSAGGQDVSLGARLSLLGEARKLMTRPISSDMGLGYAERSGGRASATALDNGYLDLGLRAGALALVALLVVVAICVVRSFRDEPALLPIITYSVVALAAGPYLVTNAAALLFLTFFMAARDHSQVRSDTDRGTAGGSRQLERPGPASTSSARVPAAQLR